MTIVKNFCYMQYVRFPLLTLAYLITVLYCRNIGKIDFQLIISFTGFHVASKITANVVDKLQEEIVSKEPYKKPQTFLGRTINNSSTNILPGQRLVRYTLLYHNYIF